ncbi:SDR family NAD(P)-dependent oxidoreductase [Streptomyces sp. NPDC020792]|uniref:SDR family NAD(P)-dependent oxidoreductase n=1 Tax=Streptomyces sp. NPDC020792 TaxID=3365089 RepID=UPI0037BD10F9
MVKTGGRPLRSGVDVDLNGARMPVAGATGVLGGAPTAEPARRGTRPALAGGDPLRPAPAAEAYPGAPTLLFDAFDPASCARAVRAAAAGLGGLDAVVMHFGAVVLGRVAEFRDEVAEHLLTGNVLEPAAFFSAAVAVMAPGSVVAAFTGAVAQSPKAGTADYSGSKAALGAWLGAVRRESRTAGIRVLAPRPSHLDTGFADRAVAGGADAVEGDAELLRTSPDVTPVVERRAR